jgi:2-hydroxychromene-2-carboxylate isomerase
MKTLDWYFDFISPFAYLQQEHFHRLPAADTQVCFKPVLLAGLLNHWGSKGPAEIPDKRRFTYRHVQWLASRHQIALRMPPSHPFNPLKALRLSIALGNSPDTVRRIFRFIWREGRSLEDSSDWRLLTQSLGSKSDDARPAAPEVKAALRENTDAAIRAGVFGVPTFLVDRQLFWGFDATDMLLDYLENPALFEDPEMRRISTLPEGARRG